MNERRISLALMRTDFGCPDTALQAMRSTVHDLAPHPEFARLLGQATAADPTLPYVPEAQDAPGTPLEALEVACQVRRALLGSTFATAAALALVVCLALLIFLSSPARHSDPAQECRRAMLANGYLLRRYALQPQPFNTSADSCLFHATDIQAETSFYRRVVLKFCRRRDNFRAEASPNGLDVQFMLNSIQGSSFNR